MAEGGPARADQKTRREEEERVLLVMIASNPAMLDDLITTLLDIGMSGATILESKGMTAILREEIPIFAGLASLLPENTGSRVLLSAAKRRQADQIIAHLEQEMKPAERPIVFTTPIERYLGPKR